MIWIGLGIAIAGYLIGLGLENLGEALIKVMRIYKGYTH